MVVRFRPVVLLGIVLHLGRAGHLLPESVEAEDVLRFNATSLTFDGVAEVRPAVGFGIDARRRAALLVAGGNTVFLLRRESAASAPLSYASQALGTGTVKGAQSPVAADLDGDGHADVLAASRQGGELYNFRQRPPAGGGEGGSGVGGGSSSAGLWRRGRARGPPGPVVRCCCRS